MRSITVALIIQILKFPVGWNIKFIFLTLHQVLILNLQVQYIPEYNNYRYSFYKTVQQHVKNSQFSKRKNKVHSLY